MIFYALLCLPSHFGTQQGPHSAYSTLRVLRVLYSVYTQPNTVQEYRNKKDLMGCGASSDEASSRDARPSSMTILTSSQTKFAYNYELNCMLGKGATSEVYEGLELAFFLITWFY